MNEWTDTFTYIGIYNIWMVHIELMHVQMHVQVRVCVFTRTCLWRLSYTKALTSCKWSLCKNVQLRLVSSRRAEMYEAIPFLGFLMDKHPLSVTGLDFLLLCPMLWLSDLDLRWILKWLSQQTFIWLGAPPLGPLRQLPSQETWVQMQPLQQRMKCSSKSCWAILFPHESLAGRNRWETVLFHAATKHRLSERLTVRASHSQSISQDLTRR